MHRMAHTWSRTWVRAAAALFLVCNAWGLFFDEIGSDMRRRLNTVAYDFEAVVVISFCVPWYEPCRALASELETNRPVLVPWAEVIQINCEDNADAILCASQGIVSYPTIRVVRDARQTRYRGAFTASGIATMVARGSLPLVSQADRALLSAMKPLDTPLLLVTFEYEISGADWALLGEVAEQLGGRYIVSVVPKSEVFRGENNISGKNGKGGKLLRATVINKLDDAAPVYSGNFTTEALLGFAEMSSLPLVPKLTDLPRFVELMKSGVPLGLLLVDDAAEIHRLIESLTVLANKYRGRINMATVDATKLPFLAEPLGVDPGRYPAFVLQSRDDACIYDQNLEITPQSIEDFILDCLGDLSKL